MADILMAYILMAYTLMALASSCGHMIECNGAHAWVRVPACNRRHADVVRGGWGMGMGREAWHCTSALTPERAR